MSGQVEPDTYVVGARGRHSSTSGWGQDLKIVRGPDGSDDGVALDPGEGARRVLTDEEVLELAALGLAVEAHYGSPQDIEWAMAGGRRTSSNRDPSRRWPVLLRRVSPARDPRTRSRRQSRRLVSGLARFRRPGVGPCQGAALPRRGRPAPDR